MSERAKLAMSKDVPARGALHLPDIPGNHRIAICLAPLQSIVQKPQSGWKGAVVARIVAMIHIHKDPAVGRHQTRKLTENLRAAGRWEDVRPRTFQRHVMASNSRSIK